MEETTLSFLMRDGAAKATFQPSLSPDQYAELYGLVDQVDTKDDLRRGLERAAARWGVQLAFEEH
jgi:hypothetical protein